MITLTAILTFLIAFLKNVSRKIDSIIFILYCSLLSFSEMFDILQFFIMKRFVVQTYLSLNLLVQFLR